jgi:hypothetical protein
MTAAKCVAIVLAYAGFFIVAGSKTLARYVCLRCATNRIDVQYRPFDIGIATFRGVEAPTWITEIIQSLDPRPCVHQWAHKRPMSDRLRDLLASGAMAAALKDDPAGALELIRRALRGDTPAESTPEDSFRRWLEEFPLEPAKDR